MTRGLLRRHAAPGVRAVARWVAAAAALPVALALALALRLRRRPARPRILWGPVPIGGTQYFSRACRQRGYDSATLMYGHYFLSERRDFDHYPDTVFPRLSRLPGFGTLSPYCCFFWALPRFHVHFHNFDGGLLGGTPLERWEIHLRHLAGGKSVLYPYGGDSQVLGRLRDPLYAHAIMQDYPDQARRTALTERRLAHFGQYADFICAPVESVDFLPRWDLVIMQMSALDTDQVSPTRIPPGTLHSEHPGKLIVFHAPNHRRIKGTDLLIRACDELKAEGRDDFELVIYERRPNREVLAAMRDADIVADQFLGGGYALFAMEAMALEKPVLCYLRPDLKELWDRDSWGLECPIVDTPRHGIKDRLRWLMDHPEQRADLGRRGRAFVERYHSLDGMGGIYESIIRRVWDGAAAVPDFPPTASSRREGASNAVGVGS